MEKRKNYEKRMENGVERKKNIGEDESKVKRKKERKKERKKVSLRQ